MIEQELKENADLFTEKFKENYDSEKGKLKTQLETYDGILINFSNIVDLYEKYKKENINLNEL